MADETNSALLDEERRMSSHQEVKASLDDDVNARIRRESAQVEPEESVELAGVARELKRKSVREAAETERELWRGRTAARISQVVDYLFYVTYGLIGLQFVFRLMGTRPGNGFVQFVAGVSGPLLAPFERIVGTPSVGAFQIRLSYLLALLIYILLHIAINGVFRIIAYRRVTV
jgi:uncharacterized protein YggT (Ycf19 family)